MAIINIQDYAYELLIFILIAFTALYVWFQYKFTYWSSKGVFSPTPVFPFGNIQDVITRKVQFFQPYYDNYFKYKHLPYIGMYCFNKPVLSVHDVELAKHILIKDFDHFQAHGIFSGGVGDPLAGHLFNIHGSAWKLLRTKMTSAFSSSKLKSMYPLVEKISKEAVMYSDRLHARNEAINFSDFFEKYTMEIIGSVGFGVECNGFNDSNSEFYLRGHEYFNPQTLYWTLIRSLAFFMPNFFEKLKIRRINPEIINFFDNLVRETVNYRYKHSYKRNDFLQTLIDLNRDSNKQCEVSENETQNSVFTLNDVTSNTMLYMFAGYETSATTGQFAAYELAKNPQIQTKAREEIKKVLAKFDGECSYEAQSEMTYMNMILDETMRKYPPLRSLFRGCTKEYTIPNTDVVIEKGTLILIPVHGIQMNPEIFPEPEIFDPERFSPDRKRLLHPCHWMPFGEGPRKCLGLRQGYIQSKLALVKLLHKYELLLDDRTSVPMKMKTTALACAAEGGLWIRLKKLTDTA